MKSGKFRITPPPGRKQVRDWNGLTVRTRTEMRNGMGVIPARTLCVVEGAGGGMGIQLRTKQCECCGLSFFISRVTPDDVEIIAVEQTDQAAR